MKKLITFVCMLALSLSAMAKDWKAAEGPVVIWITDTEPCPKNLRKKVELPNLGTIVTNGTKVPICWGYVEKHQAIFMANMTSTYADEIRGVKVGSFTRISESEGRMYSHLAAQQDQVKRNNQMASEFK